MNRSRTAGQTVKPVGRVNTERTKERERGRTGGAHERTEQSDRTNARANRPLAWPDREDGQTIGRSVARSAGRSAAAANCGVADRSVSRSRGEGRGQPCRYASCTPVGEESASLPESSANSTAENG